ncbi:MAG: hypothetical protein N3A69_11310 [Leptospiraceae bacterium]|nr:hypothetical protein [Leptospiraceae bacterium]
MINHILYKNSENWDPPFQELPKVNPEKSLQDYLKENPHKEKIFLSQLEQEFKKLTKKEPNSKLNFILKYGTAVLIFGALSFYIYFTTQNKKNPNLLSQNDFAENKLYFQSLKIEREIYTEKNPLQLIYNENLKFSLSKKTKITIHSLPPSDLAIFIHFGKIQIQSHAKHDFKIYWITKKFRYTPLGTIASLFVTDTSEILEVQEGYFLRKDVLTGQEKIIYQNTKEVFVYSSTSKNSNFSPNTRYKVPATIRLKNGQTHTGYYYEEENMIFLETPNETLKFQKSEIESIE